MSGSTQHTRKQKELKHTKQENNSENYSTPLTGNKMTVETVTHYRQGGGKKQKELYHTTDWKTTIGTTALY